MAPAVLWAGDREGQWSFAWFSFKKGEFKTLLKNHDNNLRLLKKKKKIKNFLKN